MERVKINKKNHLYTQGPKIYTSVSAVLDHYKYPYNSKYWSLYKAYQGWLEVGLKEQFPKLKDSTIERKAKEIIKDGIKEYFSLFDTPDIQDESVEALEYSMSLKGLEKSSEEIIKHRGEVLDQWSDKRDVATHRGNVYHRQREHKAIKLGFETNAFDGVDYPINYDLLIKQFNYDPQDGKFDNVKEGLCWHMDNHKEKFAISTDYFKDLEDGFYPELIIYDEATGICGTADRIFIKTIFGERFVDVDDYKTNAVIDKKSFYIRGKGYKMMKPPLEHLMDCKHIRYQLQVSIYAYMLEKMGFIVRNTGYHHLNTLNLVDYLNEEAEEIFNDFQNLKK